TRRDDRGNDATPAPEENDSVRSTRRRRGGDETGAGAPEAPREQPETKPDRPPVQPRTKRPQIPARSKLSPAEIQTLIRAGRTVRSVAQMAGTPTEWVKWLAQPVQEERRAIVANALRERQTRARLGASAEPLGASVARNLRSRGVSGADRVVDEGFTAVRSNGREWRVRLSFEHRGRRTSAVWGYDPQRHEVTPLNTLAAQLGWRRPKSAAASVERDDGVRATRAPARTAAARSRKTASSKSTSSRRRGGGRLSARRGRSSR
ncbi:MAG TPA: septation protein SepH, partial [Actinomycetota bacterium]|nr:septation protein SepH [Actinomycetota bacterium]